MRLLKKGLTGEDVERWQSFLFGQGYKDVEVDGTFSDDDFRATLAFQQKHRLEADGKVGNQTYATALMLGLAIVENNSNYPPKPDFSSPDSAARKRMLGEFRYTRNADGSIKILDGWAAKNIVKVYIPQLKGIESAPKDCIVYFHIAGVRQLQALFAAWEKAGLLKYIRTWAGTFNPRMVRGSKTNLSNHAYASAFDINAAWNGLGIQPPRADKTGTVVPLVAIANAHGFYWGGHYTTRKDGMHFELAVLNRFPEKELTPENVSARIDSLKFPKDSAAASAILLPKDNPIETSDAQSFDAPAIVEQSESVPSNQIEPSPDDFGNQIENFGEKIGGFLEENLDEAKNTVGKTAETIKQTFETEKGTVERSVSEIKDAFNPANIPAFIPRFGRQWLFGLIPGAGFVSTVIAYVENAPQWLIFLFGAITGIALWNFAQLVIIHRQKVLEFVTHCYATMADPTKNNLIPTPAENVGLFRRAGSRRDDLIEALDRQPSVERLSRLYRALPEDQKMKFIIENAD